MDREFKKFHLSKIQYRELLETQIIGVTMVDLDVAYIYFQAETTIIVSSNSESDTEDVRLRKVYTTLLAIA